MCIIHPFSHRNHISMWSVSGVCFITIPGTRHAAAARYLSCAIADSTQLHCNTLCREMANFPRESGAVRPPGDWCRPSQGPSNLNMQHTAPVSSAVLLSSVQYHLRKSVKIKQKSVETSRTNELSNNSLPSQHWTELIWVVEWHSTNLYESVLIFYICQLLVGRAGWARNAAISCTAPPGYLGSLSCRNTGRKTSKLCW